jgi:hypothetical protein
MGGICAREVSVCCNESEPSGRQMMHSVKQQISTRSYTIDYLT